MEAWREQVTTWVTAGIQGTAIHAALKREFGYQGHYSSVRRMVQQVRLQQPVATTVRLHFEPGEAVQVDFGAGPMLEHPDGRVRRTWAFVMTLCHSRHQYVEFVWDQTVATWLGETQQSCHQPPSAVRREPIALPGHQANQGNHTEASSRRRT